MSARVQSSPFRETAFDQKLDRMLDDLKSTVSGDEGELRTPGLVRSSSRASSRAGSVGRRHDDSRRLDVFVEPNRQVDVSDGGRHLETHDSKVIDGGRMSHHHKEYTSPDNRVRTVADSYQYDSSQDNPNGNYHKKVMKSTYSSYKTDGSLGKDLEDLKRGPAELEMERALSKESRDILNSISSTNKHNKVVGASEDVARSLTETLACIGTDTENEEADPINKAPVTYQPQQDTPQEGTLSLIEPAGQSIVQTNEVSKVQSSKISTVQTVNTRSQAQTLQYEVSAEDLKDPDCSTLKRLNRDIKELGSIIDHMGSEPTGSQGTTSTHTQNRVVTLHNRNEVTNRYGSNDPPHLTENVDQTEVTGRAKAVDCSKDEKMISNGHFDDDLHEMLPEGKGDGGEVRRIVWRNRYEKTYETTDATGSPMMSIERDARHRSPPPSSPPSLSALTHHHAPPQRSPSLSPRQVSAGQVSPGQLSPRQLSLQYAVYWPSSPGISPGGQSWADPVPLPTPPQQVSPREPGVAYVYNYGSSGGSAVQPLPPLNYVAVNQREGSASSPTPSSNVTPGQQPVIYHYSYHYTIQPGQPLPEGAPQPPAGAIPHPGPPTSPPATTSPSAPPALQIAPTSPTGYSSNTVSSNVNDVRNTTNVIHHHHTTTNHETHHRTNVDSHHNNVLDTYNNKNINKYPGQDPHPGTNVTGYSVDSYSTEKRDYQPFPIAPRDRSPPYSPDSRSPARPGEPKININIHETKTYSSTTRTDDHGFPITSTPHRGTSRSPDRHYGPSDSLDRVRRPPNTGLPFPNESPVKPQDPAHIPRNVDKLLSEVSERNGGVRGYSGHPDGEPLITHESQQKSSSHEQAQLAPERNEINTMSPSKLREEREKSKNQPGPAVYYPPGQEAFTESMHTMTLKEGGRRGKAKWRAEGKSGYKESSSHSESQGGTKVVPLCLPLCCGAACTIM